MRRGVGSSVCECNNEPLALDRVGSDWRAVHPFATWPATIISKSDIGPRSISHCRPYGTRGLCRANIVLISKIIHPPTVPRSHLTTCQRCLRLCGAKEARLYPGGAEKTSFHCPPMLCNTLRVCNDEPLPLDGLGVGSGWRRPPICSVASNNYFKI